MKKKEFERIHSAAQQVADLMREMEDLGLFTHHRELASCSSCELYEDIDAAGHLFVYRGNNHCDITEIHFIEKEDGAVICPECGEIVTQKSEAD